MSNSKMKKNSKTTTFGEAISKTQNKYHIEELIWHHKNYNHVSIYCKWKFVKDNRKIHCEIISKNNCIIQNKLKQSITKIH
jgi:hypothetical protein